MSVSTPGVDSSGDTVGRARLIIGGMASGMFLLVVVAEWIPRVAAAGFLVAPAGILGVVSPAIGYRLFHLLGEQVPAGAGTAERHRRYLRANIYSLAVTGGAGSLGLLVFAMTGELIVLIGVVCHVILTGALWPTEEKLEIFLSGAP